MIGDRSTGRCDLRRTGARALPPAAISALALVGAALSLVAGAAAACAQTARGSSAGGGAARPSPPRIVVAVEAGPTARRMVRELELLGLDVVESAAPTQLDAPGLMALAREREAVAVIALRVDGARAEIWIADRVTGKLTVRSLDEPRCRRSSSSVRASSSSRPRCDRTARSPRRSRSSASRGRPVATARRSSARSAPA
jgi:hypothetical protein